MPDIEISTIRGFVEQQNVTNKEIIQQVNGLFLHSIHYFHFYSIKFVENLKLNQKINHWKKKRILDQFSVNEKDQLVL